MPEIGLQPKQGQLYQLIKESPCTVIGCGGGRGSAKSSGADRVAISLMYERRGYRVCLVMRTWVKQIVPFHLEAIARDFPWLDGSMTRTPPAVLRIGQSTLEFKYAENYDAVITEFRSGNYDLILVDQAEQFTWREIAEMRKACRSTRYTAKLVLLFNMRGAGIQELRKAFRDMALGDGEAEYAFLRFNPWDNIEWVRPALEQRGYTEVEYYSWTDEQRKAFAASYGTYTRQLATDDPAIAKADWEGSWESVEGTFFASSYDADATMADRSRVERLRRNWSQHWLAQDWGRAHFCATYWGFRTNLGPADAEKLLGWALVRPINIIVVYRELIVSDLESTDVGQEIVRATPEAERAKHKAFFLSPDAFGEKDSAQTIAMKESAVLRAAGMPPAQHAQNARKVGWALMANLFKATKGRGWGQDSEGKRFQYDDAVFVSSDCPELLASIPLAMRDEKDIDDVAKTDKTQARIEQDCLDACFMAGTMVETRRGPVPIERISGGDEVWTRSGFRRVAHAWCNGVRPVEWALFSDGRTVQCTPDHRFGMEDGRFVRLDALRYSDRIVTCGQLSSTEGPTHKGAAGTLLVEANFCTARSGSSTAALFPRGTTFITGTVPGKIRSIRTISNAWPQRFIAGCIGLGGRPLNSLREFARWLVRGIRAKRAGSGTGSTLWAGLCPERARNARFAGGGSTELPSSGFAETTASLSSVVSLERIGKPDNAPIAGSHFSATATCELPAVEGSAVRLVERICLGHYPVYDIEVEGAHEFYANGLLVHNCRYLLASMLAPRKKAEADIFQEKMDAAPPQQRAMLNAIREMKREKSAGPYWKQKLKVRHIGR